jgi:glutamate-ammonia-ligase adenylyltransferase
MLSAVPVASEKLSLFAKLIKLCKRFRLQQRNTLKVLILLRELGSLSPEITKKLQKAYLFLRKVENHLQMLNDQQTHELPDNEVDRHRLAVSMAYSNWSLFSSHLSKHRKFVHSCFSQLIAQPKMNFSSDQDNERHIYFTKLWQANNYDDYDNEICCMDNSSRIIQNLLELKTFIQRQELSNVATSHIDHLMPHLLVLISQKENSANVFDRLLNVLKAIIENSIYLVLFFENPIVSSQAVNLCGQSPWISNQLARFPLLLDELLDPKTLYAPPTKEMLQQMLNLQLNSVPEDNSKQQINTIRWFKNAHVLRVAAADVTDMLPLMRVSDYLTNIATVIVETVTHLVLNELVSTHGAPSLDEEYDHYGFAVVGYGKLGGIELNYDSDLDLVYLHAVHSQHAMTDGTTPISNAQFYNRTAQRITKILGENSAEGLLYQIDLRLRPSGGAGLICHNVDAFAKYQTQQAWCWEHQALTRARPIAGSVKISVTFNAIRERVLREQRSYPELRQEITTMRHKARQSKAQRQADLFDIKQGVGGLVDIEFITQYVVLRWAAKYPSLVEYPDNIRILERAGMEGLLSIHDVGILSEAYKAYRRFIHRSSLQNKTAMVADDELQFFRIGVQRIWQQCFD